MDEALLPYRELLDKKAFGFLATISKNGSPHVTPLWVKYDQDTGNFIVNIEENSAKDYNIRRNSRVCINVVDPDNPYHYLFVQGEVISRSLDDGSLVNHFFSTYSGGKHSEPWFSYPDPLLVVEIEPEKISGWKKELADSFRDMLVEP